MAKDRIDPELLKDLETLVGQTQASGQEVVGNIEVAGVRMQGAKSCMEILATLKSKRFEILAERNKKIDAIKQAISLSRKLILSYKKQSNVPLYKYKAQEEGIITHEQSIKDFEEWRASDLQEIDRQIAEQQALLNQLLGLKQ